MRRAMSQISPRKIYEYIDQFVVGQHEAKRAISIAVFMHYVKFFHRCDESTKEVPVKNSNALLFGPSGCGKTFLVRKASEALCHITKLQIAPVLEVDCTNLTAKGWEGDDLDQVVLDHCAQYKSKPHQLQTSIIFLDEFDKICMPAIGRGGSDHNRSTQYNLLKLVEGADLNNKVTGFTVNTSGMLFVFAGNFPQIRHRRVEDNKKSIGFRNDIHQLNKDFDVAEELEKAGMISQLVGRITYTGEVKSLDKKFFKKILKHHLIPEKQEIYDYLGYELNISEYHQNKIVEHALSKKVGARGLEAALESYLEKYAFDLTFDP